jgi:MFS family permease
VAATDVQGGSLLPSRRYSAYSLGLLALINVLNYLDRNVIFALFEPIKRDLLLTDTQLGWLASAYILVFSIAVLPFGVLSDLRSRRAVIAGGVSVWSAFTLLSGMVRGYWGLFACRAMVGVGEAAYGPASQSLVADFYPGRGRAIAMAILASGVALGGVLGIWLGGQLEAIYGWRVAFMAVGAPGFLLAFLVSRLRDPTRVIAPVRLRKSLRDLEIGLSTVVHQFLPLLTLSGVGLVVAFWLARARQTEAALDIAVLGAFVGLGLAVNIFRWVRRIQADQIDDTPFGGGMGDALAEMLGGVRFVLRTPTLVYVFLGGALFSFGINGLVGWAPTFLSRELALSPAAAAVLLGKWGLVAGTAGTLFGGFLADWLRHYTRRSRILTAASGVILGAMLALWLLRIRDLDLFVPVFAVSFFCMTWFNGPMSAVIFDVVPMRIGATVMGAYLLFIHLMGDAISFPLIGFLSDKFGIDFAVMVLPAVAIVGGIVVMAGALTVVSDMDRASTRVTGTFRKLESAP